MIAIASDHAGFDLKQTIIKHLGKSGRSYKDLGTYSYESCDYPMMGQKAARAVASGECERGILVCGTGVGIGIAANKVDGIRCVICSEPCTAALSRSHNDSNMLAIGARIVGAEVALAIVDTWLNTPFSGEERHKRRVDMFGTIERDR